MSSLPSDPDRRDPREDAVRLLARREYSRQELSQRLATKGHAADVIVDTLARLADLDLQSDERFAESFVRSRLTRGQGPVKILADLGGRGIERRLASDALADVAREEGVDWCELARKVLERRFGAGDATPLAPRERARRERFLAGRGFEFDQVRVAMAAD
ncbi:regulatory protein RecX [Halomonas sp. V046]|uniref:regulatory protein RecX n=1 Tax=Halomonas sp. V046 TaxID=3459611 RepID=UPI00404462F7